LTKGGGRLFKRYAGRSQEKTTARKLKVEELNSTVNRLSGMRTFEYTPKEQAVRLGDRNESRVNFTRVIIAKIPSIIGERSCVTDWDVPRVASAGLPKKFMLRPAGKKHRVTADTRHVSEGQFRKRARHCVGTNGHTSCVVPRIALRRNAHVT